MRDFIKLIPKNVKRIITTLEESGAEVYVVGGSVRNYIVGFDVSDFDLTTNFTPDQVIESLSNVFNRNKIDTVGVSFGVVLVEGIEIASYRQDSYPYGNGASNAVVRYAKTIEEDVARRDLSINGLAINLRGDLVDFHGGIEDLKNGVIRFIGNPVDRINEDPCRVLRSLRFAAQFEATFDSETLKALQRNAHLVNTVAPERVKAEIMKVLKVKHPSLFFAALHVIGALDFIFPGLSAAVDHPHGHHHKETVWEHSMIAGDAVSAKYPLVRLAAFLHDVGKPGAYAHHGNGTFVGHEVVGAKVVEGWLKRLRFSNDERNTVVNLISTHMIGAYSESSPKAIRKFLVTLDNLGIDKFDWLRVRIADRRGNLNKPPFSLGDIRERRELFNFKDTPVFNVNSLVLKGGDIIRIFNLTPGKLIGQIQRHLFELVVENGYEFNNYGYLVEEARKFLSE